MDLLLRRTLELGARLARPGEFSERAFLNGKLDLAQAEAIADLIEAGTETAARLAGRTLEGALSRRVHALVEGLTQLRIYCEASLDFPDEDVDFLADAQVAADLARLIADTRALLADARQGQLVREGLRLVIAGPPNAGKSSLLNALSGADTAIVSPIPGTTRDLLRAEIQIDGMPLHITDTAGLRPAADPVEAEGIRRAQGQIAQADRVLWVFAGDAQAAANALGPTPTCPLASPVTYIRNKIDLTGEARRVARDPSRARGRPVCPQRGRACATCAPISRPWPDSTGARAAGSSSPGAATSMPWVGPWVTWRRPPRSSRPRPPGSCWPRTCVRPSGPSGRSPGSSAQTTCWVGSSRAFVSANSTGSGTVPAPRGA